MAANDAGRMVNRAAFRFYFPIISKDDNGSLVSAAGSPDSEVSVDGAAFADCANEIVEIATNSGCYSLDVDVAECTTLTGRNIFKVTTTNGKAVFLEFNPEPCVVSGVATSSTATTLTFAVPSGHIATTNDSLNDCVIEIVRGVGYGQVRTIIDHSASGLNATVTLNRAWSTNPDGTSVYIVHPRISGKTDGSGLYAINVEQISGDANAADNAEAFWESLLLGNVNDTTPATTNFDGNTGLSVVDDTYNNMFLVFRSGTNAGIARKITDYVGAGRNFTTQAFPFTPANGDTFFLIGERR